MWIKWCTGGFGFCRWYLLSHSFQAMQRKPHSLSKEMKLYSRKNDKIHKRWYVYSNAEDFIYLGIVINKDDWDLEDIKTRINKVNSTFIQLHPIWKPTSILRHTKLKIFNQSCCMDVWYEDGWHYWAIIVNICE